VPESYLIWDREPILRQNVEAIFYELGMDINNWDVMSYFPDHTIQILTMQSNNTLPQ